MGNTQGRRYRVDSCGANGLCYIWDMAAKMVVQATAEEGAARAPYFTSPALARWHALRLEAARGLHHL